MDIGLILLLILVNGLFAMSEMALVSARKARLRKLAAEKRAGAEAALKLHAEPSRFLSTVQVGITGVGIMNGALGEDALTAPIAHYLQQFPLLADYADSIALLATVVVITYFSVVVGELLPKRLALLRPEAIAALVARPMNTIALLASPLVWLLSSSSNLLLKLLRADRTPEAAVTDEEIKLLMEIGAESGVFHAEERHLVGNVLQLDAQLVGAVMTPRQLIYAIDLTDDLAVTRAKLADCPYSRAVVCRGGLDEVVGILQRSELLKAAMNGLAFDLVSGLHTPIYVPESLTLTQLLKRFRETRSDLALIVDEYGDIEGLATLSDVLKAIVGDLPSPEPNLDSEAAQRADGSWLIDGRLAIQRMKTLTGMDMTLPGENEGDYHTVGGFILYYLEDLPKVADAFEYERWRFEVVDIDGTRIDKVLIAEVSRP